ncbi:MAG: isochorismatase family protein [Paenibacillus sp.]|uniref:isochorismatase family protein n=1 Tax=Paenibacillus sp. TaxID=58172 RepID=UPI0025D20AEE|nr:isochorismatase family protein [Paenibacillus sp.]MBR2565178.1 isochorismatase family protein [Paenibacillus sp.]
MDELLFQFPKTAIIVIDLQNWLGTQYAPHTAEQVVTRAATMVQAFREADAFVGLVRVSTKDFKDMPRPLLDQPPPTLNLVPGWDEIVPEIGVTENDHVITKRQWGAFHGTDLDLQLRRRGITTIVLCGIASGIGVDTTAREAFAHGYQVIFATDAMTGFSEEEHDHVIKFIFPRIGRIRSTEDILACAALQS